MKRRKLQKKIAIHHRLLRRLRRYVRRLTARFRQVEEEQTLPPVIVEPGEPLVGGEYGD